MKKLIDAIKEAFKPGDEIPRLPYTEEDLVSLASIKCAITKTDRIFTETCIACEHKVTDERSFRTGELCCQVTCDGDGSCPNCESCEKRAAS